MFGLIFFNISDPVYERLANFCLAAISTCPCEWLRLHTKIYHIYKNVIHNQPWMSKRVFYYWTILGKLLDEYL